MTREDHITSSQAHSLAIQYDNGSILESKGVAPSGSTDEVDEFMDSFYLDGVGTPTDDTDDNQTR